MTTAAKMVTDKSKMACGFCGIGNYPDRPFVFQGGTAVICRGCAEFVGAWAKSLKDEEAERKRAERASEQSCACCYCRSKREQRS